MKQLLLYYSLAAEKISYLRSPFLLADPYTLSLCILDGAYLRGRVVFSGCAGHETSGSGGLKSNDGAS